MLYTSKVALCGYKNKDYSIVKNGKKQSCITLNKMNERPAYLVLAKQRFYCKCCESHFTAKTNVVDMYCYIANSTKLAIVDKATEFRSEKAIARDTSVSPTTVSRYIDMIANQIHQTP
ncbi:hypothetical protein BU692_09930 [Staphylococcus chromogenes]|nr:hypothetical protein BU692_09930 [Staphylococcus chromogenes]